MEKINFKNSRCLNLIGDFYPSDSKKAVILCHGFTADRHEKGYFDNLASAFNDSSYNVFTFDFSGSGESDNEPLSVQRQVEDLNCAIDYIKSKNINQIGLFGHSLGGLVCLISNDPLVQTIVLSAPVTNKKEGYAKNRFNDFQLDELKRTGFITINKPSGTYLRTKIVVDKEIIEVRETLDQKQLLSGVNYPVLIIHGDEDKVVPVIDSETAMRYLPESSRLEILAGEGHGFSKSINEVINLSRSWFNGYLF